MHTCHTLGLQVLRQLTNRLHTEASRARLLLRPRRSCTTSAQNSRRSHATGLPQPRRPRKKRKGTRLATHLNQCLGQGPRALPPSVSASSCAGCGWSAGTQIHKWNMGRAPSPATSARQPVRTLRQGSQPRWPCEAQPHWPCEAQPHRPRRSRHLRGWRLQGEAQAFLSRSPRQCRWQRHPVHGATLQFWHSALRPGSEPAQRLRNIPPGPPATIGVLAPTRTSPSSPGLTEDPRCHEHVFPSCACENPATRAQRPRCGTAPR